MVTNIRWSPLKVKLTTYRLLWLLWRINVSFLFKIYIFCQSLVFKWSYYLCYVRLIYTIFKHIYITRTLQYTAEKYYMQIVK
eukprot:UN09720